MLDEIEGKMLCNCHTIPIFAPLTFMIQEALSIAGFVGTEGVTEHAAEHVAGQDIVVEHIIEHMHKEHEICPVLTFISNRSQLSTKTPAPYSFPALIIAMRDHLVHLFLLFRQIPPPLTPMRPGREHTYRQLHK